MSDHTSAKHTHLKRYQHGKRYSNKLVRKLVRWDSLYGRVSVVTATFREMQKRAFKAKELPA